MTDHDRINDEAAARLLIRAGIEQAALWVDKRREDFMLAHGTVDPDTGACEFGRGQRAQLQDEYVGELTETSDGLRALVAAPAPVGREPSRPGDLVPLANGRSVDLGGRWTLPT